MGRQNLREDILTTASSKSAFLNWNINNITCQKEQERTVKTLLEQVHWEKVDRNVFILYMYSTT